jgi:dipeptidyl-peptidase-4
MKRATVLPGLALLLFPAASALLACEPPAPVAPTNPAASATAPGASALASATPPAAPAPVIDRDFLRLYTESRGFSRGAPRGATVTPDGSAVVFLRSEARDTRQSLYEMDVTTGAVRTILAPESLDQGPEHLTAEERARRERMRITANGFTAFALSKDGKTLVVTLSGKLYAVERASGKAHVIETGKGAVIDPHLSPDGKLVAYVQDDDVHVAAVDGRGKPRALTRGGKEDRPHGLADFAASEELDRFRGFWWSPDSQSILYEDSDASALEHFTIADPGHPDRPADRVPYPRAGTVNAVLRFGIVSVASPGATTWIDWDREKMPYVPAVQWAEGAPPCLTVVDRLQKNEALLVVDPKTGKTREAMREHDDAWLNTEGRGQFGWLKDGSAFLWWSERDGDGRVGLVSAKDAGPSASAKWLTPPGTQVISILDLDAARRVVTVETTRDGLHHEVTRVSLDGGEPTTLAKIDDGTVRGSFDESHDVFLTYEASLSGVHRIMVRSTDGKIAREVPSVAAPAPVTHVEMQDVGPDHMHVALVRPHGYVQGARYPLIDSAYGGPHAQTVAPDDRGMLFEQWMADATGAIVFSVDAKGTPGRGRAWERELAGKLGDVPLDGHVQAVKALVAAHPEIDGARVGIYGWSFGGYFSALAVLRRPDVFTAAVAIAPVTDWHNYDTAYTERYLGLPADQRAAYDAASVVVTAATPPGPGPQPTLLIAHGTADDNVYFFNSLQLVDALAKAGRSFRFLPFIGQTHQFASAEAQAAVWSAAAEALQKGLGTGR